MTRPSAWRLLGAVAPTQLEPARLEAHWACQLLGAAGAALAEPAADDSHTSMSWLQIADGAAGFAGVLTKTPTPLRVGLHLAELRLLILKETRELCSSLTLVGKSLDESVEWMAAELEVHGGEPLAKPILLPDYEMPTHPLKNGARFELENPSAFAELSRWFENAARALSSLVTRGLEWGPVRCWPHHFDIATLATLVGDADPEKARSINVGLSPGDRIYNQPYWYVSPWPYPAHSKRPPLSSGGHWHHEGFVAAILTGTTLADQKQTQEERLRAFLDSAISGAETLVQGTQS